MRFPQFMLFGFTVLFLCACSEKNEYESIKEECMRIKDATILLEGDGCCQKIGHAVYRFENEFYTVQGFCSCDEFLFQNARPINCDGIGLCDNFEGWEDIQNCLNALKFHDNKEHLFDVVFD